MVAQEDRSRAHTLSRERQALRFEGLLNQFPDHKIGRDNPRLIHQIRQRELATACPAAARSCDDKMRIVEQELDIQVVVYESPIYSCEHKVDLALSQLAKFQCRSVRLDNVDN